MANRKQKANSAGKCSGCHKDFVLGSDTYASPRNDHERLCEACAELMYPECVKCGHPVADEMAKVGSSIYHSHCLHCIICAESIVGKAHIIKNDLLCRGCYEDVRVEAVKSIHLAKRGDKRGALNIRKDLSAKGLQISDWEREFPLEHDIVSDNDKSCAVSIVHKIGVIRCAMCTKIVSGKAAEIGKSMLCFHCATSANDQIHKARKLLAIGDGEGADDIFHILFKHGIDMECFHLSNSSCSVCSAPIRGEGAQLGNKTICPRCIENVQGQTHQAHTLAAQGDIAGVSTIMHEMESQGIVEPSKTSASPKARTLEKGSACRLCHQCIPGCEGQTEETLTCLSCRSKAKLKPSVEDSCDDALNTNNSFASLMALSLQEEGLVLPPALTPKTGKSSEISNVCLPTCEPLSKDFRLDLPNTRSNRAPASAGNPNHLASNGIRQTCGASLSSKAVYQKNEDPGLLELNQSNGKSCHQEIELDSISLGPKPSNLSRQSGLDSQPMKRMSIPKERLVETFRSWDLDGNGQLSERELEKVFRKLGISSADIRTVFSSIDSNKDGHIDYREFVDWLFVTPEVRRHVK